NAVSWANRRLCGITVWFMKSRKNATGLPSAYLPTRIGITWSQRSDAVGTGSTPARRVTPSLVNSAFANHAPTAMRRIARERSAARIAGGHPAASLRSIGSTSPRVTRDLERLGDTPGGPRTLRQGLLR